MTLQSTLFVLAAASGSTAVDMHDDSEHKAHCGLGGAALDRNAAPSVPRDDDVDRVFLPGASREGASPT